MKLIKDLGIIYANEKSKRKFRRGVYQCDCGNTFETGTANVKNGHTSSCGCSISSKTYKHGGANTKLYKVWTSMKQRCNNKKCIAYERYGERGISICKEWDSEFESFRKWAEENGYEIGLSIDRRENDGNYEPSNCRWTNNSVQARNTKKLYSHNTSGYRGVHFRKGKWVAAVSIANKNKYIGRYMTSLEAAIARDEYVRSNNLEHTLNFKDEK